MTKRTLYIPFLFLLFLLTHYTRLSAQGESDYWYFGSQAGLHFGGGGPVALTDGQLSTLEGCATISDAAGNLLFYTDGIKVWNKLHQPTANGFGLNGDPSSTQSAMAIPKPGAPGRYYVFTVAASASSVGFCYSEYDMALDGGLGDVIAETKNTYLIGPVPEKVTAIGVPSAGGYWVITHGWENNEYYSFWVSASGVSATPIVSSVGTIHGGTDSNAIGQLKISPDGKKLAAGVAVDKFVEVLDFDPNTGTVSNPLYLDLSDVGYIYGVEFSSDNSKLYVSTNSTNALVQYNLSAGSPSEVVASLTNITASTTLFTSMQLGKDAKVYVAQPNTDYLGVIQKPNEAGLAATFVENAVDLAGKQCSLGLPSFIQSFFDECAGSSLRFFSTFKKSFVCADCANGKIATAGIGGVKPYTYAINEGPFQNSGVFNGLPPGLYTIRIKDAMGCEISRVVKLGG